MKTKHLVPLSFIFLSATAFTTSDVLSEMQTLVAPTCLMDNTSVAFEKISQMQNLMLVQVQAQDLENLRKDVRLGCGGFLNITQKMQISATPEEILADELERAQGVMQPAAGFQISYPTQVNEVLQEFDAQKMWANLTELTKFSDRASTTQNGVKAAQWLKDRAEGMAKDARRTEVTARFIETGSFYKQPSVVVTIPGKNPKAEGVLIGGHMDSLSRNKPGADDDGSGSVTVLETLRAILNSSLRFERTLYFVWYAAEEQGLIGSQVVANEFKEQNVPLRGVIQFDMTGYNPTKVNKIYLMEDYVDSSLTNFVEQLAKQYAKTEVGRSQCGYACSDHASWTREGYRAATPFETSMQDMNPYIHTANDTMDRISLEHMSRFARIGIAFMTELGEPSL